MVETWDVKLYGTWHRGGTLRRTLRTWTQKLREPYEGYRASSPYGWVELPGLDLKVHATWKRSKSPYSGDWTDWGTFEVRGIEVQAATEAVALRKAQAIVRRRLSAQMCTPPRLEFT